MKYLQLFLMLTVISLPLSAKAADDYDILIKADGMVCDFCAQSLNKVFTKKESVESIDVDLDTSAITVNLKQGQDLTDDEIKELIEWGGYDLVSIERKQ